MGSLLIIRIILMLILALFQGCFFSGEKALSINAIVKTKLKLPVTLAEVNVSNGRLKIKGSRLSEVTDVEIKKNNIVSKLKIETRDTNQIILSSTQSLSLLIGQTFNLILSNAYAEETFSVTLTIQNGTVTGSMLSSMGAQTGQFLKFDGNSWIPSSLSSSQQYLGTYDASTNTPDLNSASHNPGDYYIVTDAGTFGGINYPVNSWIIFNGITWEKISHTESLVTAFKGRRGLVVPMQGDYNLSQLGDVDLTTLSTGKVLKYNGTKWMPEEITGAQEIVSTALESVATNYISKSGTNVISSGSITIGGTASINVPTPFITNYSQATNVQYVTQAISSAITTNGIWIKGDNQSISFTEGNVGMGTTSPGANTKLSVEGQIRSKSFSQTTGEINWANGNAITTSFNCGSTISFANLRDGGSYTLVVTSSDTTQCSFSTTTTGDDAGTVSYRFMPENELRTVSSHTLYSFQRIGSTVYVSWISGF